MSEILAVIISTLSKELLLPLIKELLHAVIDSEDIGIDDANYDEVCSIMDRSKLNSRPYEKVD